MAVSDLNVRIGVLYRDFDKSMRQVENRMKQTADRLGGIADGMMTAISLPLAGLGAASIKAAGEMESLDLALQSTMKNAGYSTQQAAAELEALRKIALAPGIDFEQAVKGSIRLQAVGFSAARARDTLVELANALAASGGTAQQLDGVTRQFAQMSAKGKIMQEDLTIILENMPSLAKVLMDAFGTTNAEAIRKMGVSADEFIDKITSGLQKTERVQGGIANAIVNTQMALKQFFATIGMEISKAYDLNKVGNDISETLSKAAQAFRLLDPETKKSIINFGLMALAIGPAIKAMSLLYSAGAGIINGFRLMVGSLKSVTATLITTSRAFVALNTTMKLTIAGAVIAGVIALAAAYNTLSNNVNEAFHVSRLLNETQKKGNEYAGEQIGKAAALISVVKDETRAQDQRRAALEELQYLYPKYFANLSKENIDVVATTNAYEQLAASIKKAAMVRAAEEGLSEVAKQSISLQERRNRLIEFYNKNLSDSNKLQLFNNAVTQAGRDEIEKTFAEKRRQFAQELAAIDAQISGKKQEFDALVNVRVANTELANSRDVATDATVRQTQATSKSATAVKGEKKEVDDLIKMLDALDAQREQLANAEAAGNPLVAPTIDNRPISPVQSLKPMGADIPAVAQGITASYNEATSSLANFNLEWQKLTMSFQEGGAAQKSISDSVLASVQQMAAQGSVSMKDFARAALSSALSTARAKMIEGIFAATSSALVNVPFPANIAAAGLAAGAAGALLNGLINRINPPKLARGGLAYGETMAVVGDNPRASVDPEVIAPLSKLQSIMGSGVNMVHVVGKISGRDILLATEKEQRVTNRFSR